MARTYAQLQKEIEALQAKAEAARKSEAADVVARIKQAITAYGLSAEELGFGVDAAASSGAAKKGRPARAAKKSRGGAPAAAAPKFRDADGNVWGGRGPQPAWFKKAIASGVSPESLRVDGAATASPTGASRGKRGSKPDTGAKYRDESGNTWSGRGPKPGWFKAALAAGKTPEELAA